MIRLSFLVAAALTSAAAITATVEAAEPIDFTFRLTDERGRDGIYADFRRVGRENSQWNSNFPASAFVGLDRTAFSAQGNAPLQFALVRDAGRLDCAGTGGGGTATGRCRFTANPAFLDFLRDSGVPSPSGEDAYSMTAVGVSRDLVSSIREARYPAPTVHTLISLAALGVDRGYVDELAAAGYRPDRLDKIIEFKALGITPDYIAGMQRLGMGHLSASELVQFKALGIDADYIQSLRGVGYDKLPPGTLVEFKALGVTASYIAELQRLGYSPPPSKIVQMKALGITPGELRALEGAQKKR